MLLFGIEQLLDKVTVALVLARELEPFGYHDCGQFLRCAIEVFIDNNIIKINEMRYLPVGIAQALRDDVRGVGGTGVKSGY